MFSWALWPHPGPYYPSLCLMILSWALLPYLRPYNLIMGLITLSWALYYLVLGRITSSCAVLPYSRPYYLILRLLPSPVPRRTCCLLLLVGVGGCGLATGGLFSVSAHYIEAARGVPRSTPHPASTGSGRGGASHGMWQRPAYNRRKEGCVARGVATRRGQQTWTVLGIG
jgi:hypothetical protein